jgi:hypothetical protein
VRFLHRRVRPVGRRHIEKQTRGPVRSESSYLPLFARHPLTSAAYDATESNSNAGAGNRSSPSAGGKSRPFDDRTNGVNDALKTMLIDAVAFLNDERIVYSLIGGLASSFRGQPRVTVDVDLGLPGSSVN